MKVIEYLDALPGTGKSTAIIEWMLKNSTEKFVYISPYLDEVERRIPEALGDAIGFEFPVEKPTKSAHFLELLKQGKNVSTTHALLQKASEEHLSAIRQQGYHLINDEEIDMITSCNCKSGVIDNLLDWEVIQVNSQLHGQINLLKEARETGGEFGYLLTHAKRNALYVSKRSNEILVTQLPVELLNSFKRTIILTHKFEGSVLHSYLKLHGLDPEPFKEINLGHREVEVKRKLKSLLKIESTPSVDALPDRRGFLSVNWFNKAKKQELDMLKSALRSIYRKHNKKDILLTCPKENVERGSRYVGDGQYVNPKVVAKQKEDIGWIACSTRATNEYRSRTVMVHAFDRYPNQAVSVYFSDYGVPIDQDEFALAELIQWLWRGCIRDGNPMTVYILSGRMKKLLEDWLNEIECDEVDLLEAA